MQDLTRAREVAGLGLLDFARTALPELFSDAPGGFQHALSADIDWLRGGPRRLLLALPREHGKTSLGCIALVLQEAARCWLAAQEPSQAAGPVPPAPDSARASAAPPEPKLHILIIGANQREACQKLALIRHELETNHLLNELFPGIAAPARQSSGQRCAWRRDELQLACGLRLAAYGTQGRLRSSLHNGLRPDLAILDDPEDDSHTLSQKRRQSLQAWCERTLLPALDHQRGGLVWLGTLLHHESVLAQWIARHGRPCLPRPVAGLSCADGPAAPAAAATDCHGPPLLSLLPPPGPPPDPAPPEDSAHAQWRVMVCPALDEESGALLWPGRWTQAALDLRRSELGEAAFAQEYLLQPVSALARRFQRGDFDTYAQADLARQDGVWTLEGEPLTVVAAMDPACGLGAEHDYSAVAVLGFRPGAVAAEGAGLAAPPRACVLEIARLRGRFDEQLGLLDSVARRWRPRLIGIESNAYQGVLQQAAAGHGLPVEELKASRHKGWRLENLSTAAARGQLALPLGGAWLEDFYAEALHWPSTRHDDQLDALAHALVLGSELLQRLAQRRSLAIYSARRGCDVDADDDAASALWPARSAAA